MAKGRTDARPAVNPLAPRAYRYGIVLILLFCTFLVMASGLEGKWIRVVSVALQGITLLAVLHASQVSRRVTRVAEIGVVLALLGALGSVVFGDRTATSGVPALLSVLLVATAPYVIARALWRRQIVDIHTVLGAICVYVLLGMLFAFLYEAIGTLGSTDFFVQTHTPDTADYLYFSFVTLTTVGYGDFTAATHFGRALAVLEALFGQIYLVTVVSLVVSRLVARPRQHSETSAPDTDQ